MQKELQQLGFTDKEARAYAALAGLGEVAIGALERKTRIHKQLLYPVLHSLADRGFVAVSLHNGRKHFAITDPDFLRAHIESQKAVAETLVPQIYAQMGAENTATDIKTYRGTRAVQAFFIKMLKQMPAGSNLDILGAGGEAFMSKVGRPGLFLGRYDAARTPKKLSHRMLMYENQRGVDPAYTVRRYVEARYLPETFHQPMATHIWPDRVSILFFDEEPQIIEIKSTKMAEGFRNYFEMLWRMAKG